MFNLKNHIMEYKNKYNVTELSTNELNNIQGGGFFRSLGRLCRSITCAYENSGRSYADMQW